MKEFTEDNIREIFQNLAIEIGGAYGNENEDASELAIDIWEENKESIELAISDISKLQCPKCKRKDKFKRWFNEHLSRQSTTKDKQEELKMHIGLAETENNNLREENKELQDEVERLKKELDKCTQTVTYEPGENSV